MVAPKSRTVAGRPAPKPRADFDAGRKELASLRDWPVRRDLDALLRSLVLLEALQRATRRTLRMPSAGGR